MKKFNFKVSYDGGYVLFSVKAASKTLAKLKAEFFSGLYFYRCAHFHVELVEYGLFPLISVHKLSSSFKGAFLWGSSKKIQKAMRV